MEDTRSISGRSADFFERPESEASLALDVRPRLRGRLHLLAAGASVFGLVWLVSVAPTGQARVAAVIYGLSALALYAASASYHVFAQSDRARQRMQRVDHSMIYVLIAGTLTPICMLAMSGWSRWIVLGVVWAGAVTGAAFKLLAGQRFSRFGFALYLILGWAGVASFPALVTEPSRLVLAIIAGLLYTVGAVLFAVQWPLRRSTWFGYHEVWHSLGTAAGALFFAINLGIIATAT